MAITLMNTACYTCPNRYSVPPEQVADAYALLARITIRELEVLDHVAHGKSNKEIARALGISDQTVKNHLTSIFIKLDVADRTQAVVRCIAVGVITPSL